MLYMVCTKAHICIVYAVNSYWFDAYVSTEMNSYKHRLDVEDCIKYFYFNFCPLI